MEESIVVLSGVDSAIESLERSIMLAMSEGGLDVMERNDGVMNLRKPATGRTRSIYIEWVTERGTTFPADAWNALLHLGMRGP
jgi:hypothetical protein